MLFPNVGFCWSAMFPFSLADGFAAACSTRGFASISASCPAGTLSPRWLGGSSRSSFCSDGRFGCVCSPLSVCGWACSSFFLPNGSAVLNHPALAKEALMSLESLESPLDVGGVGCACSDLPLLVALLAGSSAGFSSDFKSAVVSGDCQKLFLVMTHCRRLTCMLWSFASGINSFCDVLDQFCLMYCTDTTDALSLH